MSALDNWIRKYDRRAPVAARAWRMFISLLFIAAVFFAARFGWEFASRLLK